MSPSISLAKQLDSGFLQGRPLGRSHFPKLCALLMEVPANETVYLDFADVELVTASWINEALAPLLDWASNSRNDLFPVLVNFKDEWLDELNVVSELSYKCFLVCKGSESTSSAILIGKLDIGQRETLDAVTSQNEVTGAMLERIGVNPAVQATAWNNRLRDLYQKRLLKRQKIGREQIYSSVIRKVKLYG